MALVLKVPFSNFSKRGLAEFRLFDYTIPAIMLMIRLQRIGKKGQAYFRVVLNEHTKKAKGEFHELLGTYNPHQKQFQANRERIEYWMSKGAQISPTVNNLMVNYKIWDRPKIQSWKPKQKKKSGEHTAPIAPEIPTEQPVAELMPTA